MNGHVKSMCFLHLMEPAAGMCDHRYFFYSNIRNSSTLLHLFLAFVLFWPFLFGSLELVLPETDRSFSLNFTVSAPRIREHETRV